MRSAIILLVLMGCRTDKVEETSLDTGALAAVDADGDGYDTTEDCDDGNSLVSPAAEEICDGADNDCDGEVDEGVTATYYEDSDGDGFGSSDVPAEACSEPDGYVAVGNDCDDTAAEAYPGGEEVCDGLDNDCDGEVDDGVGSLYYADADADGYGDPAAEQLACSPPSGTVEDDTDCDDTDASSFPGSPEVCDEADNNCDGTIDEGVTTTYYRDADADRYGLADDTTEACVLPTGYAETPGDCDDTTAAISPDAAEVCNAIDDDCDNLIDDEDGDVDTSTGSTFYTDGDGDGFGDPDASTMACLQPSGTVSDATDCDDSDADVSPDGDEVCNSIDDDCDGDIDDDDSDVDTSTGDTFYTDDDGDGYGDPDDSTEACVVPSGHVSDGADCDDGDAGVNPGASEVCDSIDNDCDGDIDDDDSSVDTSTGEVFYTDADGDGYGDPDDSTEACVAPSGAVEDDTDCDDGDVEVNPGASEVCHGDDLDCDGVEPDLCASCLEIVSVGSDDGDGVYTIDTATAGEVDVYCDMATDGGGWTLAQRTVWSWSDSSLLLTDYSDWYGSTLGYPDAGEAFRLAGEIWSELNVDEDHLLTHYARDSSSTGDCDPLYYIGTGGAYTISSTATSLTAPSASVTMMNTTSLSTTDVGPSTGCVNSYNAIPWFYTSCCTTCPTFKGSYWSDAAHPMASYISSTADENGLTDADVCPSGAAVSSYGYEGVNVMEYYLR